MGRWTNGRPMSTHCVVKERSGMVHAGERRMESSGLRGTLPWARSGLRTTGYCRRNSTIVRFTSSGASFWTQ
jgi:hypothetical protein